MSDETVNGITRESFTTMDTDAKLNVLFDYAVNTHQRIKTLENKMGTFKLKSSVYATIAGFIGGASVAVGKMAFWKS
jgi:hypothetical protein